MEAPKKLYVDTEDRLSDSILYGFTKKRKDDDIEYIRKDAFIEKACDYLSYHLDTSKIDVNYKFDFIEEFRNYMKGE